MNQEKLFLAHYVYIARVGATIDGQVVTETSHPDNDPASNWYSLGCVDNFEMTTKTATDAPALCFDAAGNLTEDVEEIVIGNGVNFTCVEMDDLARELAFGLSGPVQDSQAVNAYQNPSREIKVWLKVDALNMKTKVMERTQNIHGVLKLANSGAVANGQSTRPQYVFEKRGTVASVVRFGPAA